MKSRIPEAIILAFAIVILSVLLFTGVNKAINRDRVVHVRGLAEMEIPADKVFWNISYNITGNDMQELFKEIARNNSTIKQFMIESGIPAEDISFNPPNIIDMESGYYSENNKPKFHYSVISNLTIATSKVDLIGNLQMKVVDLADKGIIIGSNYANYEFTGLSGIKPEMIEKATKDARAAAEKFAKDSDSKLGKIRSASQGVFSIENRDENTPNIKKIRVVTSVDFALED